MEVDTLRQQSLKPRLATRTIAKSVHFATNDLAEREADDHAILFEANNYDERTESAASGTCHNIDAENNSLWWTTDELANISKERKKIVMGYLTREQIATENDNENVFLAVYNLCSLKTTTVTTTTTTTTALDSLQQVIDCKPTQELLVDILDRYSDLRGLEAKFSKVVARRRRQHVRSVLSIVERQRHGMAFEGENTIATTTTITNEMIALKSEKSSRASQALARIMAEIDAINDEEDR